MKESRKLEYDDEFKQKINELGLVIKKIETNQNSQSKIFADFKKYLKIEKLIRVEINCLS